MDATFEKRAGLALPRGVTLHCGDALEVLRGMPSGAVHCCVTSPPYYGLRCYGVDGQIGLEQTPDAYVARMVEVFREVRRVLRDDGCLWLNLGDSYNADGRKGRAHMGIGKNSGYSAWVNKTMEGTKPKDLLGIPWLVAFALRADGWYLRADIVWAKANPMPESVQDRPTKSHEYVFLLAKRPAYYYDADAIKEPATDLETMRGKRPRKSDHIEVDPGYDGHRTRVSLMREQAPRATRNLRSVWSIPTAPYEGAHFAVFPPALVEPCVLAGTSAHGCCPACGAPWVREVEHGQPQRIGGNAGVSIAHSDGPMNRGGRGQWDKGHMPLVRPSHTTGWRPSCNCGNDFTTPATVLDPFAGSGTTLAVALAHGRHAIGIDLNPAYLDLARRRLSGQLTLWDLGLEPPPPEAAPPPEPTQALLFPEILQGKE